MLITIACYLLQLYADFSGYTNIALGIGKLFGVEGPPNFDAPFAAVNIQEMWRRWHMSLTSWVTDYLFTPLSMSLRGLGQTGLVLCIMLNMIDHRPVARVHPQFSRVRPHAWRFRLGDGADRDAPQAPGPRGRRQRRRALADGAGRHGGGLRPDELFADLLAFADLGPGDIHPGPGRGRRAERADRLGGHAALSSPFRPGSAWASPFMSALARPARAELALPAGRLTPNWLQYGVCLFLLFVLATEGNGQFVYGQF